MTTTASAISTNLPIYPIFPRKAPRRAAESDRDPIGFMLGSHHGEVAAVYRRDAKDSTEEGAVTALLSPPRTIVLVGLMGAGKTNIGRRLAARLHLPFIDADSEIEAAAGE